MILGKFDAFSIIQLNFRSIYFKLSDLHDANHTVRARIFCVVYLTDIIGLSSTTVA